MSFYMNFGAVNEGEQAEAYKKKKADEKAEREKKDLEQRESRYNMDPSTRDRMIRTTSSPGSQAQHYETFKEPSPETLIPKDAKRNLYFYQVKDEDKEKNKADKSRADKTNDIVDREHQRRADDYFNAPYGNSGKRPSIFKPNARKEYDKEDARIRKEHEMKKKAYMNMDDTVARDAVNRHIRRHPEAYKEFGIFAEACFIDE